MKHDFNELAADYHSMVDQTGRCPVYAEDLLKAMQAVKENMITGIHDAIGAGYMLGYAAGLRDAKKKQTVKMHGTRVLAENKTA